MASSSNPQIEELAPSTSSSTSMLAFVRYEPPTTKLALESDKRYHVFLSFRGEDVRKTLVDHLFQALSTAGLNVFLDSDKLEKGEIFGLSLERAIKSSAICIPIFSKGYADSAWCLKEAAAMLSTSGLIIPLFYHVDPTDVRYPRNESSPYKQAFIKHYGHPDRHPREEVDEWQRALHQICSRSGWSMDITQGFEARLVKTMLNDLLKTLDRMPFEVAKHPVGIDSFKDILIHKLNLNSVDGVVKLGIWGIGGIGKTTVAKALYNQVFTGFEAASFVSDVRATAADATGLPNLQKQILKDLIKNDENVTNVDQGISLFKDRLRGKRVLLILDDVDDVRQLYALLGDWLGPGSRVIITSRDQHILNVAHVECIHEMSGLEINEGLQLFSWHAFLRATPSPSYEDLSTRIVQACKGHPLSLEVIGSFLYDKQDDTGCWMEALQNITLNPEIHNRLYISYRALSDNEKEIFVDVACFFIGEHKRLPIVFWKSLYDMVDIAVSNLSMKLLIRIDDQGAFHMHDHLRDLGQAIAEQEKKGTRLWKAAHLSTLSNSINFSRLRLNVYEETFAPQRLEMLYRPELRYLHLQGVRIEAMTEDTRAMFPPSLIWLRLEHCTFAIGKDKVINKILTATRKATRKIRHSRSVGKIKQLKIMQLNNNIFSKSPLLSLLNLQHMQHMQHMELRWCKNLKNLPHTIGNLSHMQHMDLSNCESLKNLHDTIGNLSELKYLDLRGCVSLTNLPDTIGNLLQLQHLDLRGCVSLTNLPDTIGNLSQLQHLDLKGCVSLTNLPNTIGYLSQLQHLDLKECEKLNNLPDTIGNLSQFQKLDLKRCGSLTILPNTIGNLSQLQHLDLRRCVSLTSLPGTIDNLLQLQHLDLRGCGSLTNLPDTIGNLSQLQHLDLRGCVSLTNLPDTIGNLSQLQALDLIECEKLNNLPDAIGNLSQFQKLDLEGCGSLNILPDTIGNLSQLQHLDLRGCVSLTSLPDTIGNLSQLQHLELRCCESLNNLPNTIGNLSQLQHLQWRWCGRLTTLPDTFGNLSQLQHLDLGECGSLTILPDTIGNLSQLQKLVFRGCGRLNNLPDTIGNLSQLQHLDLGWCGSLHSLPDAIGNLSQLRHLHLGWCGRLNNLPDTIGNLSQLRHLNLEECGSLTNLPDSIGNLSQLYVCLRGCGSLTNLPSTLANIKYLHKY